MCELTPLNNDLVIVSCNNYRILITESLHELLDWLVTFEEKYSGKASVINANSINMQLLVDQHSPFPEIFYVSYFKGLQVSLIFVFCGNKS